MNLKRSARWAAVGVLSLALGACLGDGATPGKSDTDTSATPSEPTASVSSGLRADGSIVLVRKSR